MEDLLTLARKEFPGFEPIYLFEAAIPVYFLNILVEALESQKLNSLEIYFLYALANEVQTIEEIAWLYGIDESDLLASGAALLKYSYIRQELSPIGKRLTYLTDKGRQALGKDTLPPVPTRRGAHLHFNALTWTLIPLEKQLVMPPERMTTESLCILPSTRYEKPTLGDLTLEKVTSALHGTPYFHDKQIIALLEIQRNRPEYLAPVQVVCLQQSMDQQQRLAIFRRNTYLRNESSVLQRFFETGKFSIPDDAISLSPLAIQIPSILPQTVALAANTLVANEVEVRKLQIELDEATNKHATTQNKDERNQLENRIRELEALLRLRQEESEQLQAQLKKQQGTFLRTEEHRAVLEQSLRQAQKELIIIAPWLNRRTCDDTLCTLIAKAVKRGVHIRIGYGITERPNEDVERNRNSARRVIRAMEAAIKREGPLAPEGKLDVQRVVVDTHQKILVCDRIYGILGSFNWLSYRGELDEQYRSETSVVLREPNAVIELAKIALRGWPG